MPPTNLPGQQTPPDHLLPPHNAKKDASYGALISIVLILAIIVVGAFYVWGQRIEQNGQVIELPEATTTEAGQ